MDDAPSKPNFFERLINRLTGDAPETADEVVNILRQAHERKCLMPTRWCGWKKCSILPN